ncbi:PaaI family thioesterase [Minwuia sp.]|uniref:PaaI family thioesterase n=1 Tax=Minwuia sp. TaxID=2493630 RepID=UPI003A8DB75D
MTVFEARQTGYADLTRGFLQSMPVFRTLGLDIASVSPGRAEISMTITTGLTFDGTHVQGGIVGALLDIAGGAAAMTLTGEGHGIATLGFETHHLAPAGGEYLVAVGRVIKPGRNQALSLVEIFACHDASRSLCATGHVTSRWIALPDRG